MERAACHPAHPCRDHPARRARRHHRRGARRCEVAGLAALPAVRTRETEPMAVPPGSEPGEGRRTYPCPSQPSPPPAPGPSSPLSAIFARSLLFPMMGATVVWAVLLAAGTVLGTQVLPATDLPYSADWQPPVVALVGCGLGRSEERRVGDGRQAG